MSWDFAGIAKGLAEGFAGPFSAAWKATKDSQTAIHTIDRNTDRDMTVAGYQADQRFGEFSYLLTAADRNDRRTSWIRPLGAGIALYVFACVAIQHSQPRVAALLWIETSDLPMPWGYVAGGIILALFGLRWLDRYATGKTVATMHTSTAAAQGNVKALLDRLPKLKPLKREDAM